MHVLTLVSGKVVNCFPLCEHIANFEKLQPHINSSNINTLPCSTCNKISTVDDDRLKVTLEKWERPIDNCVIFIRDHFLTTFLYGEGFSCKQNYSVDHISNETSNKLCNELQKYLSLQNSERITSPMEMMYSHTMQGYFNKSIVILCIKKRFNTVYQLLWFR